MSTLPTGRAPGCAAVRAALHEPLRGTAPERARSWLLLEHPGPWPHGDWPGDLPLHVRDLLVTADEAGVRPQLVRRTTDRRRSTTCVLLASCRPGRRWTERRVLRDLRELAGLDLDALAAGEPPGFGERCEEPVVLVCTHGRRDVCCARLGRPLAVLLDAQLPGRVWETTHVGGDRFAPNVVALPDGSYHGDVRVADVPALADAITSGRVLLPRLRGFAGSPAPVQAAEAFLREHTSLARVADVRVASVTPSPAGVTCVELLAATARWCVHVRSGEPAAERLTSCAAGGSVGRPAAYELVGLRRLG